ncbi:glycosyltransferase family 39 protein, partial [Candidatus Woesebacteria bacterium]|nr:glycosyltransferase family 39 protein [Candidatus Woesebacteria bacterium]
YTPGFLYWLWLAGKVGWLSDLMIKIPVVFADVATGALIWWVVRKADKKFANLVFFFYILNPAVIFNGSVWGQIDGIFTLFLFLSAYFLIKKENYIASSLFWALSFLIKPQAIAVLPALSIVIFKKFSFKGLLFSTLVTLVTLLPLSLPFFPQNPVLGLPALVAKMSGYYSYTSVFAFNFWSLVGMWKPDSQVFLGLSLFWWGIILYAASLVAIIYGFRKNLDNKVVIYLILALSSFSFFLFPTRVHERYLFPALSFLLVYAGLTKSKGLIGIFGLTSVLHLVNLYHSYSYYEKADNVLKIEVLQNLTGQLAPVVGIGFLLLFLLLIFYEELGIEKYVRSFRLHLKAREEKFQELKIPNRLAKFLVGIILAFSFVSRIYSLGSPPNEYFDEVYHAFTAKVILHNDPKAWEWWNTPPEGFAYEWTHPPLAKLGMVLGMKIFGENSFGWRIPGALLGTLSVLLVYLIAKEIFKDETLALLSSAIFSLDGLGLVMSRIGMNDIYFLFFALTSIYFFLRERNFLSALAFGLSFASKWSAIWAVPIFFILWFSRKKKFKISYLWFLIVPPIVYLATYIPMFLSSHGLDIFWGMQKQMWWYHTGLRATHPYTSPWWTWPFLVRPIYLYTSEEAGGVVSRIYAMGSPVIFWFGLVSVILSFIYAFVERNKKLGLVLFSYLVFFVPWA